MRKSIKKTAHNIYKKRTLAFVIIIMLTTNILSSQNQVGSNLYGEAQYDLSGSAVAVNATGNIMVVGAKLNDAGSDNSFGNRNYGHARVYQFIGSSWVQLGGDIDGLSNEEQLGSAVSINAAGTRIALGAIGANSYDGSVRIYDYEDSTWVLKHEFNGTTDSNFGTSVSLDNSGNTIAIGTPFANFGEVVVYKYNEVDDTWDLLGSEFQLPSLSRIGYSISLNDDGTIVAIGSEWTSLNFNIAGGVAIYQYDEGSTSWNLLGDIIHGTSTGAGLGNALSLNDSGTRVVIGASSGAYAEVYEYSSNIWTKIGARLTGTTGDKFGASVAINDLGNRIFVSATEHGFDNIGQLNIYDYTNEEWTLVSNSITGAHSDELGNSIATNDSGSIVVIGSAKANGNGTDSGITKVFEIATVSTTSPIFISNTSVYLGGNAISDEGNTITERGIVFSSTDTSPLIGEADVIKNDNGTGLGTFNEFITGLTKNTTYYVRAYATNAGSTFYGAVESFMTLDKDNETNYYIETTFGQSWSDNTGWSLGRKPVVTDDVVFDSSLINTSIRCILDEIVTINSFTLNSAFSSLSIVSPGSLLVTQDFIANGSISVSNGANLTVNGDTAMNFTPGTGTGDFIVNGNLTFNAPLAVNMNITVSGVLNITTSAALQFRNITLNNTATWQINESQNVTITENLTNLGTITLAENNKLSIEGDLTQNGTMTLESGSSLILGGDFVGNDIIYKRNLATDNWYLVSPPFYGESVLNFYMNNASNLALSDTSLGFNQRIALAPYDNSQTSPWQYYTLDQIIGTVPTTDVLTAASAYSVKLNSLDQDLIFRGSILTEDKNDFFISRSINGFNLVGNPYPSYVSLNEILNANDEGSNDLLEEKTAWLWNQDTNQYDAYNLIDDIFIAPGQGFFVEASATASTFSITESMQSHQPETGDTFQRTITRPEIKLSLSNGSSIKTSDIFYITNTTTGWDNGYDSTLFGDADTSFAVYTHLVSNSQGQDLAIQSLPDSNYEQMIIPVGVNAVSGSEITFSATAVNFPSGINLYLEDKENQTFTRLDSSENYTITTNTAINGIGRFYLHTSTESVLSTPNEVLEHVSIYTTNKTNLRITGISSGKTQLSIYNILGQKVLNTSFEAKGLNDIQLPVLKTGVYVIQLVTKNGKYNKKIVIE